MLFTVRVVISLMTEKQKLGIKQATRKFYRDRRITLETAVWAMKNAGYSRKETAEWLELKEAPEIIGEYRKK
jgi:hypothetical protein